MYSVDVISGPIRVSGLRELNRAFSRLGSETRSGLRAELKQIAAETAALAREYASAQGFDEPGRSGRGTGQLARKIKVGVITRGAYIAETAVRDSGPGAPFSYPRIYEFGGAAVRHTRAGTYVAITNRSRQGALLRWSGTAFGLLGQYGPRAFMYPAAEHTRPTVRARVEALLGGLIAAEGLGRGGN